MQSAVNEIDKISSLIGYLEDDEKREVAEILASKLPIWVPLDGPQTSAYESQADILYYGGSAGGGKTDLLLGLALTEHRQSIIFRRQTTQLIGIQARLLDEIMKSRKGWNGQDDILTLPDRKIEFGSCNNIGDEIKYQGRPHDFLGFDEITHFLESQFRFLIGWMRTTRPGQRCRIVCAGNPPTTTDGQWVISYWAPWLDPKHPNPALPGELRWFTTVDGKDQECENGNPVKINGRMVKPLSRTFIPSNVTDNPFLMKTGYEATLQGLPEPLRSQMLNGDFAAGMEDSAWQVIPTAWVDEAMERWTPTGKIGQMDSVGADVARGGSDKTTCAVRYGKWYDKIKAWPGSQTPNGAMAAGLIVSCIRDRAPVHVDALGVGGETVGHLENAGVQTIAIAGYDTEKVKGEYDKATRRLKFRNLRAMIYWRFRESLDPVSGDNIALPPDQELKADLCCAMWKLTPGGILIEQKDEIKKRIGRSPDKGDAVLYCSIVTPKRDLRRKKENEQAPAWDPMDNI